MNNLRPAPSGTKRRRGLSTAVVLAALLAGAAVGVMLPDSTAELDAAHKQLDSLTTRTELLSAELTGAKTDNTSMADLVAEAEGEVRALGKELAAQKKRGDARAAKLDQREKALDERRDALDEQKTDVGRREDALDERRDALDQQTSDLDQREEALDERRDALDQQKAELDQRESELDRREEAQSETR
jgi:chromosome segregation protein